MDVVLKEDDCRVRKDNAPQNCALMKQIAVNLLGKEKRVKRGIKNKQFLATMNNNYLERVLSLAVSKDKPQSVYASKIGIWN
ncbi:hypothetical protein ACX27_21920 [Nostoc piscinale CENA21]|uniref:Transposase n=1 Tax=Nostoc piscinale CENA21 TaxID=224013 RepID=A0A0M4TWT7_9NOSO|nr:hypothetical protein ACX27_21920 [Nostoc piscinale CENA21]